MSPRPHSSFKRAILFPVDEETPKLIWVECERLVDSNGEFFEMPKVDNLLGDCGREPIHQVVCQNTDFGHSNQLRFQDNDSSNNPQRNQSIARLTGVLIGHVWKGPVVAFRQPGVEADPKFYNDITLVDLRHTLNYLITYRRDPAEHHFELPSFGYHFADPLDKERERQRSIVKGVRINCQGDQMVLKKKPFEVVEVPRDHPIFRASRLSEISARVGFSLLTRPYPPSLEWLDKINMTPNPYENVNATFLHLDIDPDSNEWGRAPRGY